MSGVGDMDEAVDTQGVSLTNVSDSKTYVQTLTVVPHIEHSTDFNQLTNDTVDKIHSLMNPIFEVTMIVTTTEFAELLALTVTSAVALTRKTWRVEYFDSKNGSTDLQGLATISNMRPIDSGAGSVILSFTIDFTNLAVNL